MPKGGSWSEVVGIGKREFGGALLVRGLFPFLNFFFLLGIKVKISFFFFLNFILFNDYFESKEGGSLFF